jgi:hypothetical protein
VFTAMDQAGFVCEASKATNYIPDNGILISFDASKMCHATGYKIGRLDRYLVWTNPNLDDLKKEYPRFAESWSGCTRGSETLGNGDVNTNARGYSTFDNPPAATQLTWPQTITHILKLPLRRYYGEPWFQPTARYGYYGNQTDFLEPDPNPAFKKISEYVSPKVPGELFLYVNDAVLPVPASYQWFYNQHRGCMSMFIKPSK